MATEDIIMSIVIISIATKKNTRVLYKHSWRHTPEHQLPTDGFDDHRRRHVYQLAAPQYFCFDKGISSSEATDWDDSVQ